MSGLMMVLGGMVAGPGLLAAWEVYGEHTGRVKADSEPPEPARDEPATESLEPVTPSLEPATLSAGSARQLAPESMLVVEAAELEQAMAKSKRRSRFEPAAPPALPHSFDLDDDEDDEAKTVLFRLADVLDLDEVNSVLLDE